MFYLLTISDTNKIYDITNSFRDITNSYELISDTTNSNFWYLEKQTCDITNSNYGDRFSDTTNVLYSDIMNLIERYY